MMSVLLYMQKKKKNMKKRSNNTTNNTITISSSSSSFLSILIISLLFFCSSFVGKSNSISTNDHANNDDEHLFGGSEVLRLLNDEQDTNLISSSIITTPNHDQGRWWGNYDEEDEEEEEEAAAEEPWEMVGRNGKQFVMKDSGRPFYINGFNTYWLMLFAVDPSTRGKVTEVFQQASSVGLTVCRTWAFNDGGYRALQKSPSVYDEDVFKALDFVVSEAKKYKIRLILSLVNNWDAFGGRQQYVKWGKEAGLNLTSDDDFYSHPNLKTYYKNHVQTVLTRVNTVTNVTYKLQHTLTVLTRVNTVTNVTYKDDPTIFAWELMNEPRCTSDPSGDKLQAWIVEMAMHVKSIDPKHLLEIGLEGFYGPSTPERVGVNPNTYAQQVGTDFIRNHQALGIDFASVHMYADSWISQSVSEAHIKFVRMWMKAHIDDAEKKLGGMPVVFSEFGVSRKDSGYNASFKDTLISTVYKTLLDSTKKGGSGSGSLVWQLFPDGTDYMDDGYAIVLSKAQSTASIISLQSTRLSLFNSRCSWRCHWGCRKKLMNKEEHAADVSMSDDDEPSVSQCTMHDDL